MSIQFSDDLILCIFCQHYFNMYGLSVLFFLHLAHSLMWLCKGKGGEAGNPIILKAALKRRVYSIPVAVNVLFPVASRQQRLFGVTCVSVMLTYLIK